MKTKFKIVETNSYTLSVSDGDIKTGDLFLHKTNRDCSIHLCIDRPAKQNVIGDDNVDYFLGNCKKIIGYKPKNNAPELNLLLPDSQKRLLYKDGSEIRKVDLNEKHKDLLSDIVEDGLDYQTKKMYTQEEVKNIAYWAFDFYKRNDLDDEELENEFERMLNERFKKK